LSIYHKRLVKDRFWTVLAFITSWKFAVPAAILAFLIWGNALLHLLF
jgi:hypothetical protein